MRRGLLMLAEREGFEPSRGFKPPTRLAGERLRPLGHLSRYQRGYQDPQHSPSYVAAFSILWAHRRVYEHTNPGFMSPPEPWAHSRIYRHTNPGFRAWGLARFRCSR